LVVVLPVVVKENQVVSVKENLVVAMKENQIVKVLAVDEPVNSVQFKELDATEVKNALAGGSRKSRHSEVWACNAFDEWRLCNGYSVEKSIADLSEEPDIRLFVNLLFKFTLQVRKADGSLYPPSSYVLTFSLVIVYSLYFVAVCFVVISICFTAFHD
jgi:hypothetical protein